MAKLEIEEIQRIREDVLKSMSVREDGIRSQDPVKPVTPIIVPGDGEAVAIVPEVLGVGRYDLLICGGTGCHSSGSIKIREALLKEIEQRGLIEEVHVVETGCIGFCAQGPIIVVYPGGIFYQLLTVKDIAELIDEQIVNGRTVERLMYLDPVEKKYIPKMRDITFFKHQELRVLRNRGLIDAEKIDEYIARDGYVAMMKAFKEMSSEEIISEIKDSGLRGRGGGGFLTGLKWEFCRRSKGDVKYIICNADEGDPGAFMDRSVLEADPHAVIEGMLIAAKAIGARQGYVYCRAEYPLALKRLTIALEQAADYGFLGKDILGTGFDFDVEICQGAGAFVCGEETGMIASIEGKRGMPKPRPPFPADEGLWKKPTNINNVETLATVAWIIRNGSSKYAETGTEGSKGTKVFCLVGKVSRSGLAEVAMGTTLRQVIFDIGGGVADGKKFKAVQMGGPSGGCLPEELLDTLVDYDAINATGAIMGSGGMVVVDSTTCMVDLARYFLSFTQEESCGKCVPCRLGTKRMLEILERICEGEGESDDLTKLDDLAADIKAASLCALGGTAPNPVLTTIKYFRNEYEDHILHKKCTAGECPALITITINSETCTGCGACVRVCPKDSITGEKKKPHVIDQGGCIQCKMCISRCPTDAIIAI